MTELLILLGGAFGVIWLLIKGRSEGKTLNQAKQDKQANETAKEVADAQEANRSVPIDKRRERMFGNKTDTE